MLELPVAMMAPGETGCAPKASTAARNRSGSGYSAATKAGASVTAKQKAISLDTFAKLHILGEVFILRV